MCGFYLAAILVEGLHLDDLLSVDHSNVRQLGRETVLREHHRKELDLVAREEEQKLANAR